MEKWLEAKTIATWIIVAFIAVLVLTVLIIKLFYINFKRHIESQLNESRLQLEHQRKLIETSVKVQERERIRIAADLHDTIIGKLTVLRLKNQLNQDASELDKSIEESIAEARRISHDISPPMLEFIELADIIENTVNAWQDSFLIRFHKNVCPDYSANNETKLQIKRILQEMMTNTHKHAEATEVWVKMKISPSRFFLVVNDNGKGFNTQNGSKGLGLKNIELRVLYLNGSYKMKSGTQGTTTIFSFNL